MLIILLNILGRSLYFGILVIALIFLPSFSYRWRVIVLTLLVLSFVTHFDSYLVHIYVLSVFWFLNSVKYANK